MLYVMMGMMMMKTKVGFLVDVVVGGDKTVVVDVDSVDFDNLSY